MQITYSKNYKKDYKRIIQNKHLVEEDKRIENIKNIIISSDNLHELLISSYSKVYRIEQKHGDLKEIITARINKKLRLYMKPVGDYPYNYIEIVGIEFVKIDDKHYGEG